LQGCPETTATLAWSWPNSLAHGNDRATGLRFCWPIEFVEGAGQVVEGNGDVRVPWPKRFLLNCQGAAEQTLGILGASLSHEQRSEVTQTRGKLGMVGPERLLGDYELATIKGLCLGIASFEPAQLTQIVEHGCNRVAFRTELFF
jgi:hypothetical protein